MIIEILHGAILTNKAVKYQAVRLGEQIRVTSDGTTKTITQLRRFTENVGDPIASKRLLLMAVIHSILLYGCKI